MLPSDVADAALDGELLALLEHPGRRVDGEHGVDRASQFQGYGAGAAAQVKGVLGAVQAEPVGEQCEQVVGVSGAEAGVGTPSP